VNLGAEPKKVVILAALLLVAAVLMYRNVFSTPGPPARASAPAQQAKSTQSETAAARAAAAPARSTSAPAGSSREGAVVREFRPTLRARRPEDRPDPATIDPTLKLGLLARVQSVELQGTSRNLFEFGAPPRPAVPEPKIIPQSKDPKPVVEFKPKPAAPSKPPPPAIPLKFYGYVQEGEDTANQRAFFLNGDEIFVAGVGETLDSRYKIVSINLNAAVVEDTQFSNRQTINLEPPPDG
jgi:hypothetical protein